MTTIIRNKAMGIREAKEYSSALPAILSEFEEQY